MALETLPWSIGDDEAAAAYIDAALEDGTPALVAAALRNTAEARQPRQSRCWRAP